MCQPRIEVFIFLFRRSKVDVPRCEVVFIVLFLSYNVLSMIDGSVQGFELAHLDLPY